MADNNFNYSKTSKGLEFWQPRAQIQSPHRNCVGVKNEEWYKGAVTCLGLSDKMTA